MHQIIVNRFGGPEVLAWQELDTPEPGPLQVRVRLTSIGMNHADLMGRRGEYKASTGDPPYVPGIEGGGVIEAVGPGVDGDRIGQRVSLGPDVPRAAHGPHGGTYRSHILVEQDTALTVPDAIPDEQLGTLWLSYLTAWGCLAWKDKLPPGSFVGIPAASSSVGLAAAQVVKRLGSTAIGLTSSPDKTDAILALASHGFDHLITTHEIGTDGTRSPRPWHREIKKLTDGHGVDVFFDPVASGHYLSTEVRCLAPQGRIYIYGLLGDPGPVDLSPLIIRQGSLHGWVLYEIVQAGIEAWGPACHAILSGFEKGDFRQAIAGRYALRDAATAHAAMECAKHVGKWVLIP
ncbi:MAG: zinc-binding dehydrogenase [Planctomycetota bacterium]